MQASGSMFPQSDNDTNPVFVLQRAFAPLAARYDYILIDCSPHPDLQMINALAASDSVIVPIQALSGRRGLPDTLNLSAACGRPISELVCTGALLLTLACIKARCSLAWCASRSKKPTAEIPVFEQPIDYSVRVAEHPAYGEKPAGVCAGLPGGTVLYAFGGGGAAA